MTEPQDFLHSVHLCNFETQIANRLNDPPHRCLAVAGTAQRRRVVRHGELHAAREGSAHRRSGCAAKDDHGAASGFVPAPAYS